MRVSKSTKDKCEAVCFLKNCKWQLHAIKDKETKSFQVTKLSETDTYSNIQLRPYHRQDNKQVLGHFLKDILADSTCNILRAK